LNVLKSAKKIEILKTQNLWHARFSTPLKYIDMSGVKMDSLNIAASCYYIYHARK